MRENADIQTTKKKTKAPETTRLLLPTHSIHIRFQKHPSVRSRLLKNREDGDHDGVGVAAWRGCLGDIFDGCGGVSHYRY